MNLEEFFARELRIGAAVRTDGIAAAPFRRSLLRPGDGARHQRAVEARQRDENRLAARRRQDRWDR